MKKYIVLIFLSVLCLSSSFVFAADKVIIVPMGTKHYMYWQGVWATDTSYKAGDAVQHDGSSYIHTSGATSYCPLLYTS